MNNPVAPKEGHYALLRNGSVVHPECITKDFDLDGTPYYLSPNSDDDYYWTANGVCQRQAYPKGIPKLIFVPDHDIIATISPADMQAVASGELERLRAALRDLTDCFHANVRMSGPTYSIVNGTRFRRRLKLRSQP
jgi:hypothetical protein